jgi:hypothetical protein
MAGPDETLGSPCGYPFPYGPDDGIVLQLVPSLEASGMERLKTAREHDGEFRLPAVDVFYGCPLDRNFPCQSLKIRKVSVVVMGS